MIEAQERMLQSATELKNASIAQALQPPIIMDHKPSEIRNSIPRGESKLAHAFTNHWHTAKEARLKGKALHRGLTITGQRINTPRKITFRFLIFMCFRT